MINKNWIENGPCQTDTSKKISLCIDEIHH